MAQLGASGEDVIGRIRCPQLLLLARTLLFNSPGDYLALPSCSLSVSCPCQDSAAILIICPGYLSVGCPCLGSELQILIICSVPAWNQCDRCAQSEQSHCHGL